MKVAVLYGEISDDRPEDQQDSLVEVKAVSLALSNLGYTPEALPLSIDIQKTITQLRRLNPTFVFNLVDTVDGHGSLIYFAPALLDYLRIPYTGVRTEGQFTTSNKLVAKKLLKLHGLPTPKWVTLEEIENNSAANSYFIFKSVWEHSSIGLDENSVVFIPSKSELKKELETRNKVLFGECFAELYVDGRELNVTLLAKDGSPEVLPPAEIRFNEQYYKSKTKVVDFRAKWIKDSKEYQNTNRCFDFSKDDQDLIDNVTSLAKECWYIFELRGYARVDFRIDNGGNPWILEINANPCLSPDAGFVSSAVHAGLDYDQIIERIIKDLGF
jgi:D-alanine-D-alanine ligase